MLPEFCILSFSMRIYFMSVMLYLRAFTSVGLVHTFFSNMKGFQ